MLNKYTEEGIDGLYDGACDHLKYQFISKSDKIRSPLLRYKYGPAFNIMEKDWDNLILLDACRYDIFRQHSILDGELTCVFSHGNSSWDFMEENFYMKKNHDVVYITTNPHYEKLENDDFYCVESLLEHWDSELGTILPETVTNEALKISNNYENKRFIIHYMQPHSPHLSEISKEIGKKLDGWTPYDRDSSKVFAIWEAFHQGLITQNELRESYIETLNRVEQSVKNLLEELSGKTVVSSDHGDNLGESYLGINRVGHGNETKECRLVPWLEMNYSERRTITKNKPKIKQESDGKIVDKRLKQLGYI